MLVGAMARQRRGQRAFELRRRAALHARGDFLAEQFQEEFGHVQSFKAGSTSVWAKSPPLNSFNALAFEGEIARLAWTSNKRLSQILAAA